MFIIQVYIFHEVERRDLLILAVSVELLNLGVRLLHCCNPELKFNQRSYEQLKTQESLRKAVKHEKTMEIKYLLPKAMAMGIDNADVLSSQALVAENLAAVEVTLSDLHAKLKQFVDAAYGIHRTEPRSFRTTLNLLHASSRTPHAEASDGSDVPLNGERAAFLETVQACADMLVPSKGGIIMAIVHESSKVRTESLDMGRLEKVFFQEAPNISHPRFQCLLIPSAPTLTVTAGRGQTWSAWHQTWVSHH